MCLWVTVYSFIPSTSFNDEVIILFGTVGFWTTVVITIILAIGEYLACRFRIGLMMSFDQALDS
jgi:phospholipid-translocating ATPase